MGGPEFFRLVKGIYIQDLGNSGISDKIFQYSDKFGISDQSGNPGDSDISDDSNISGDSNISDFSDIVGK